MSFFWRIANKEKKHSENWGIEELGVMKNLPDIYVNALLMVTSFLSITEYKKNTFTNVSAAENQTNHITLILKSVYLTTVCLCWTVRILRRKWIRMLPVWRTGIRRPYLLVGSCKTWRISEESYFCSFPWTSTFQWPKDWTTKGKGLSFLCVLYIM